jgi:hypothetical protein
MRPGRGRSTALAGVVGMVLISACGKSDQIDEGEVENKVREELTAEVGAEPESVECDGDLPAEVGATLRCVLTAPNGDQVGLTVTATEVADDDVRFEIVVDDELMS